MVARPLPASEAALSCRVQLGPGTCVLPVAHAIPPRTRVTLRLPRPLPTVAPVAAAASRHSKGGARGGVACVHGETGAEPVAPGAPPAAGGPRWGFLVQAADSLAYVISHVYRYIRDIIDIFRYESM